jgi:hypothetical protein
MKSAAGAQVFGQGFQRAAHDTRANPLLKPAMAGLIRRITLGQISPGSARTQNVQNPIEHGSPVLPGTASAIFPAFRLRNQWVEQSPLLVSQVSGVVGGHLPQ